MHQFSLCVVGRAGCVDEQARFFPLIQLSKTITVVGSAMAAGGWCIVAMCSEFGRLLYWLLYGPASIPLVESVSVTSSLTDKCCPMRLC